MCLSARYDQTRFRLACVSPPTVVIKPYVLNDLLRKIQSMWSKKADAAANSAASAANIAATAAIVAEQQGG